MVRSSELAGGFSYISPTLITAFPAYKYWGLNASLLDFFLSYSLLKSARREMGFVTLFSLFHKDEFYTEKVFPPTFFDKVTLLYLL